MRARDLPRLRMLGPCAAVSRPVVARMCAASSRSRALGLAIAAGLGLAGCGGTDGETCDIATGEISAVALVIDSGWDVRASVDFEVGDRRGRNSPLRLCSSDVLTINGELPEALAKADRVEYALSLPRDGVRSFRFELDRQAEGDRVMFEVELPPPFELLEPMDGDVIDFSQEQVLQWDPALPDGSMQVGLGEAIAAGECLVTTSDGHTYEAAGGVTVADAGQWTIPAGAVASTNDTDCTVTYTLSRVELAPYPAELERSGRVEARTERYVDVSVLR
jgi:hypothetical protein